MYCVRLGGGVMCDWEEGEEVFVPESMNMHLAVPVCFFLFPSSSYCIVVMFV